MESVDRNSYRAQQDELLAEMKVALWLMRAAVVSLMGLGLWLMLREFLPKEGPHQLLAETVRGPEEQKMVERAAAWLESKDLNGTYHLQCRSNGECALTYTRNGVLHGAMIRCYDKGCIALSGW